MFHEGEQLLSTLSHSRKWCDEAEKALSLNPDLKHLQSLISTGESLPIAYPDLVVSLQAKVTQAETWIERARNAIPHKKTRKHADTEKVGAIFFLLRSTQFVAHAVFSILLQSCF